MKAFLYLSLIAALIFGFGYSVGQILSGAFTSQALIIPPLCIACGIGLIHEWTTQP